MAATKPAFNPPGKKGDIIFSVLVKLAALIVLLMLGGIIVSLIISSWPSIQKFGLAFLWTKEWDAPNDIYGALVPIYGTLVTSFIALLIAVPVSFGIALFLTETIIVGLAGGLLGYAGGLGLAQAIGYMVFGSSIAFVPVVVGLVAVLVILVVLGASIPAIRYLLRLNAAEVLHGR